MSLGEAIGQQPLWLQIWVYWMVITNLAGILLKIGRIGCVSSADPGMGTATVGPRGGDFKLRRQRRRA